MGEFCPIPTFSSWVCFLPLGQIPHSCQDTAKNEGQRKENTKTREKTTGREGAREQWVEKERKRKIKMRRKKLI